MHRRNFLLLTGGLSASMASALPGLSMAVTPGAPLTAIGASEALHSQIAKASGQRTSCQRMAKCYLAIGQGVEPAWCTKSMTRSVKDFDAQVTESVEGPPDAQTKAVYERIGTAWAEFRSVLTTSPPLKEDAEKMLTRMAALLALTDRSIQQLEAAAGTRTGRLIGLAANQSMLSQRMAMLYLSTNWGVRAQAAELQASRAEFLRAHSVLQSVASGPTLEDLMSAEQQFTFFDVAIAKLRPGVTGVREHGDVVTTSERIQQVMDGVANRYARAA